MRALRFFPLLLVFACSADPIPAGYYTINTGQETDTLTMSPAPVSFTVISEDANGNTSQVQTSSTPITTINVGITGQNFYLVNGVDSNGVSRVKATSYLIDANSMAGNDLPLFLGRTDAFCRPTLPNLLQAQGNHPPVGIFWGQTLWIAGATNSSNQIVSEGYDLIMWAETAAPSAISPITCPSSPCQIQSIATYAGEFGLAIGANWAMSVDITANTTSTPTLPSTMTNWSDVAGGRTINASTGAVYVVGPTRNTSVTSYVLELGTDGSMNARTLSLPRQFAAATHVEGQGLLVVGGGDATDGSGAEFLADSSTAFVTLPYPPDTVTGAALLPESTGTRVWRMGGQKLDGTPAPSVVYDIACTGTGSSGDAGASATTCTPESLSSAFDLGMTVTNANGFGFGDNRIIIGEQTDGTMVAWRVTDTGVTPIPLREPRKYATAYSLPNGFAALIGGTLLSTGAQAFSIELVAY